MKVLILYLHNKIMIHSIKTNDLFTHKVLKTHVYIIMISIDIPMYTNTSI